MENVYSFQSKISEFKKFGKLGEQIIEEFRAYMKEDHNFEFHGSELECFNQKFIFEVHYNFRQANESKITLQHLVPNANTAIRETREVFNAPLRDLVQNRSYHNYNDFDKLLTAIIQYIENYDKPLISPLL
jgi:hypothetical protein